MKINKINDNFGICPICESRDLRFVYHQEVNPKKISFTYKFSTNSRKTLQVLECKTCTHLFCYPIPANIYKNYKDVIDLNYLRFSQSRILTSKKVIENIKKHKSSGSILDIGCATGDFLLVAKENGFRAEGLELSKWSSKIGEKKGLKIYRHTLKSLSKKYPKRYDIITMWGVIEHFEKPYEELVYINKLLKKGGLLVLWTGDVSSLTSKILGKKWWYWQGQHLQYFTHSSLNKVADKTGLKHVTTSLYPQAMSFNQLKNSLDRYKYKFLILFFLRPLFIFKPIWYFRIPGEMFWIGKKK